MSKELAKAYEPREVEDRIYDFWLQGGYFHAEVDPEKKPYTIVIPLRILRDSSIWDMP